MKHDECCIEYTHETHWGRKTRTHEELDASRTKKSEGDSLKEGLSHREPLRGTHMTGMIRLRGFI